MSNIIIKTGDNSPTLFSNNFGVHYHSIHGATTETDVVFIKAGLAYIVSGKNFIKILEVGFGTGLNRQATLNYAIENNLQIFYTALEKYPVDQNTLELYIKNLPCDFKAEFLLNLHLAPWRTDYEVTDKFTLQKIKTDFQEFSCEQLYDLVYYDAFAPETQPELWTTEMFEIMAASLYTGGVLTTYCAKGYVKRNLKSAGFDVEKLPGPPGKREMTRATKI